MITLVGAVNHGHVGTGNGGQACVVGNHRHAIGRTLFHITPRYISANIIIINVRMADTSISIGAAAVVVGWRRILVTTRESVVMVIALSRRRVGGHVNIRRRCCWLTGYYRQGHGITPRCRYRHVGSMKVNTT